MAHARMPLETSRRFLLILVLLLVLAELIAFGVAWKSSGKKSWLQVQDSDGTVIYETRGDTLTRFDRYYFEQNFGPLNQYRTRLVTREVPFPLTGWLFAAIGVPVGLVLFMVFVVKVWRSLFPGEKGEHAEEEESFAQSLSSLDRPGVLVVGGLVFAFFLALWVLPVLISRTASSMLELIWRFRWVFAVVFAGFLSLCFWFLYLRYRLARQAMETRADLERLRLTLGIPEEKLLEVERRTLLPAAGVGEERQGAGENDEMGPGEAPAPDRSKG